jgi:putative transposase
LSAERIKAEQVYYTMFHPTVPYHIYNHSNRGQVIFKGEADYLLFIEKLRQHIRPAADVLAYCLMPTHFHLLVLPTQEGCKAAPRGLSPLDERYQQLHAEIRTVLSSYTRKVNQRNGDRGSLFRAKTKNKPGYADFIPEAWELGENIPFTQLVPYLRVCFDYIHDNPVRAGLVSQATDWPYSSAADYAGLRQGSLPNYAVTKRILGIERPYP